ncbi:MAG TPA: beta-galactosidase family protein [Terracidiphilus sp.]|jgi:beta-galactosidase|nr:beta-galactosidase family protein [Terracidiphilus sp.]
MASRFHLLPLVLPFFCLPAFGTGSAAAAAVAPAPAHTFTVSGHQFLLDGKPYQIISGEMHYTRVPRAYWRDRFRKARAMGLNTITTYVFWNVHEPSPGVFDFSGQNDIAEYLREAQQEGLHVILRPGPYVCAEWDLGGFPSWLLKDRNLVLRSEDPKYLAAVQAWFTRLGKEIQPLLLQNGGPIIAIQVENEYGSFGDDHAYMEAVKSALKNSGMDAPVLYTADGPEQVPNGSLPELPAVINFGTGDAEQGFAVLRRLRPDGPFMSGEYWAGWFDHWGERHHRTDGNREAAEVEWMLKQGYSVSLYMFHGGTSFGWMNGANSDGNNYQPDTTSYDYDAPLDEQGTPRDKFFAFRDAIARATGQTPPALPPPVPVRKFPVSQHMESAPLWDNLPAPVVSKKILCMEDLGQSYGYILYRTELKAGPGGELVIDGLHDYAQVYVDRELVGTLDRRLGTSHLMLPPAAHDSTLDILVENTGRVNFTKVIRGERKGITGTVTIARHEPDRWQIFPLPMNDLGRLPFAARPCSGPCFYRARMDADPPADTYLDTSALHKGFVWINSRPLGRFWDIGPQLSLYTPGPWIQGGTNEIVLFDLRGSADESIGTTTAPVFKESGLGGN